MACKRFGTHTGSIGEWGSYYSAHEAADNVADEVSVGYRDITDAVSSVDGGAWACDNGCGTLADEYFAEKKLVAEAASIASYVGGKPGGGGHLALGGPYGAGALAANVSLICADASTYCDGHERM